MLDVLRKRDWSESCTVRGGGSWGVGRGRGLGRGVRGGDRICMTSDDFQAKCPVVVEEKKMAPIEDEPRAPRAISCQFRVTSSWISFCEVPLGGAAEATGLVVWQA